jgi:hypothetical protein
VTWQGSVLVRLGVSLLEPTGTSWAEIPPPGPQHPLRHSASYIHLLEEIIVLWVFCVPFFFSSSKPLAVRWDMYIFSYSSRTFFANIISRICVWYFFSSILLSLL